MLTGKQAALAAASGAATGGFGYAGGRLAKRLGLADVDTAFVSGLGQAARAETRAGFAKRVLGGALSEGVFEELPQSMQEQALQNIALGKPWAEGMDEAAVLGILSGGVMGGGMNLLPRGRQQNPHGSPPSGTSGQQNPGGSPSAQSDASAGQVSELLDMEQGNPPASPPAPLPTPHEQLGIDPNAGTMSEAAALAVDSGASPVTGIEGQETGARPVSEEWQKMSTEERLEIAREAGLPEATARGMAASPQRWEAFNPEYRDAVSSVIGERNGRQERMDPPPFDSIARRTDADLAAMLRNTSADELLMALKGASQETRNRLLGLMSERAAEMVQEELDNMGPVRRADAEAAQRQILERMGQAPQSQTPRTESEQTAEAIKNGFDAMSGGAAEAFAEQRGRQIEQVTQRVREQMANGKTLDEALNYEGPSPIVEQAVRENILGGSQSQDHGTSRELSVAEQIEGAGERVADSLTSMFRRDLPERIEVSSGRILEALANGKTLEEAMRYEGMPPSLGRLVSRVVDLVGRGVNREAAIAQVLEEYDQNRGAELERVTREVADRSDGLQNRNRSTPASIQQMTSIAANPDYQRLSYSRDFGSGAPVVSGGEIPVRQRGRTDITVGSDGRRIPVQYAVVEAGSVLPSNNVDGTPNRNYGTDYAGTFAVAGNGRIAGLQAAYQRGTAGNYAAELTADAQMTGIDREVIAGMQNPVLVRVMNREDITSDIGDVSNTAGNLTLSSVEQAENDANRVDLSSLSFAEDGSVSAQTVRDFVVSMPQSEQGGLLDANGQPTRQAVDRLNAAIFVKGYADGGLVRLYAQAQDMEAANVLNAMAQAAPMMARLEGMGAMDIRSLITDAAGVVVTARRNGVRLEEAARQLDMSADPLVGDAVAFFARHIRSAKRISEGLKRLAQTAYNEAIRPETDLFGDAPPKMTRAQLISQLGENDGQRNQESLEYQPGQEPLREDARRGGTDSRGQTNGLATETNRAAEDAAVADSTQTAENERADAIPSQGAQSAEVRPNLELTRQTEAEARQEEQRREEADNGLTKEQIDRERDGFTLSGQSQPKPQGMQQDLLPADGRATVAAGTQGKEDTAKGKPLRHWIDPDAVSALTFDELKAAIREIYAEVANGNYNNTLKADWQRLSHYLTLRPSEIVARLARQYRAVKKTDVDGNPIPLPTSRNLHKREIVSSVLGNFAHELHRRQQAGNGEPGAGGGHAQPLTSWILTPSGWRQMGDLAVGDVLFAANGEETTVEGIYPQGIQPVFLVHDQYGGGALCTADHLWTVREEGEEEWKTVPTSLIMEGTKAGKRYELSKVLLSLADLRMRREAAAWAEERRNPARRWRTSLQNGLDSILIALGTQVMRGFGALHRWLYAIHKRARNQFVQLVTLLLSFPAFELGNLGFKFMNSAYQRKFLRNEQRMLMLYGVQPLVKFRNDLVQFTNLGRYRRIQLEREQTVHDLCSSLDAYQGAIDAVQHDLSSSIRSNVASNAGANTKIYRIDEEDARQNVITGVRPFGEDEVQCIKIAHPSHLYVTNGLFATHNTYGDQETGTANAEQSEKAAGTRPQGWRGNFISASQVARGLGIDPSQYRNAADLARAIDRADGNDKMPVMEPHDAARGKASAGTPQPQAANDRDPVKNIVEAMRSLAQAAGTTSNKNQTVTIAKVSNEAAKEAKDKAELDISGYTHTADMFAVRHTLNQHGDATKEAKRGQIAITSDDIAAIPEAINAPDARVYGVKNNRKQDLIASIKRLPDGTLLVVEEVRTGRKTLALASIRKVPAAKDFDSVARTLLSNAQSDGGDKLIIAPVEESASTPPRRVASFVSVHFHSAIFVRSS